MKKIVVFASGNGSNAENIFRFFKNHVSIQVERLYSNKSDAYVIERARNHQIPYTIFNKNELIDGTVTNELKQINPDLIVLAGFLLLIPESMVESFPNKIINVHPALLPKYGGKGMYGMHVHQAVFDNKETETGITFHFVNEKYDDGMIISQFKTDINSVQNPKEIAERIHQLEHQNFPHIIEKLLM